MDMKKPTRTQTRKYLRQQVIDLIRCIEERVNDLAYDCRVSEELYDYASDQLYCIIYSLENELKKLGWKFTQDDIDDILLTYSNRLINVLNDIDRRKYGSKIYCSYDNDCIEFLIKM